MRDFEVIGPDDAKDFFSYDPETGIITRNRSKRTDTIGEVSTFLHNGYLSIYGFGRLIRAHRLAWVLMTGEWPKNDVDHINRDRTDNRWCNLREATRSDNLRNTPVRKTSRSGYKGVEIRDGKFCAYISVNNKKIHLGAFDNPIDAHKRYCDEARKICGEFHNPGDQ